MLITHDFKYYQRKSDQAFNGSFGGNNAYFVQLISFEEEMDFAFDHHEVGLFIMGVERFN